MSSPSSRPPANLLRQLRRRAGLTQAALSEGSGVSVRTIRHIERGEVDAPHHSSVLAIAEALQLTEDGIDALLRSCLAEHVPTSLEVLGSGPDVDPLLEHARIRTAIDVRALSASYHLTVGPDRRIVNLITRIAVQAVRDDVDSMLVMHRGDGANDISLNRVHALRRCTLVNRLDLPEHRLTLCELGFGRRLAAGDVHILSHQFGRDPTRESGPVEAARVAALGVSDGFVQGPRRRARQHVVEVTFTGAVPRCVWEIEQQPDGTVHRLREVTVDGFNAVHTIGWDRLPGPSYGFEWAWSG